MTTARPMPVAMATGALIATSLVACSDEGSLSDDLDARERTSQAPASSGEATEPESSDSTTAEDLTGGTNPSTAATTCTTVRREILQQVDEVSEGRVSIIEESGGAVTLFVDGSAGGFGVATTNPYVYVRLDDSSKVTVTDLQADDSTEWDIAIKRQVIRTNSGDSGPGSGGAAYLGDAGFDDVAVSDVSPADILVDDFIDDSDCTFEGGEVGEIVTPFSPWYLYEQANMTLTPRGGVFVVRSGDGQRLYKLEILDYYALPDGSTGPASAFYALRYESL